MSGGGPLPKSFSGKRFPACASKVTTREVLIEVLTTNREVLIGSQDPEFPSETDDLSRYYGAQRVLILRTVLKMCQASCRVGVAILSGVGI